MQKNYCDKCKIELEVDKTIKILIRPCWQTEIKSTNKEICIKCYQELFGFINK